jgi:hypothetical protein
LWIDREGNILAEETREHSIYHGSPPELTFSEGFDKKMMDLLAVVWCARLWHMKFKEELSKKGEGKAERKAKKILPLKTPKRASKQFEKVAG